MNLVLIFNYNVYTLLTCTLLECEVEEGAVVVSEVEESAVAAVSRPSC